MEYHDQKCSILGYSHYFCYWLRKHFTWYYCSLYFLPGDGDDAQDGEEDDHDTTRAGLRSDMVRGVKRFYMKKREKISSG